MSVPELTFVLPVVSYTEKALLVIIAGRANCSRSLYPFATCITVTCIRSSGKLIYGSIHDWSQVGAHGTGARLPPVDEQVISMKLVTPAKGTIELSKEKDPELFYLARCGLGGLGVVAEVTLQCVERHQLVQHTFVSNADEVKKTTSNFSCVNLYVPSISIYMVCLCSCYILKFLPFSPFAGSGSQKTNILSTCGFLILTQLLLSNAILPQSGEPQSWHQNMEKMKHYIMFATFIGSRWKNIGAHIHLLWFDNPSFNASSLAIPKNQTKCSLT